MAWLRGAGAAVIIELVAYGLGISWGFAALVLAFAGMAIPMAAKTRTTEQRVNAIMPVLATHAANITAAQTTANGAQTTATTANNAANNAQGAANTAQSAANNAQATANGAVQQGTDPTFSAMTVTGSVTVEGNLTVDGSTNLNAQLTANDIVCTALTDQGSMTIDGNLTVDGGGNVITHANGALTLSTSGSGNPDGNSGSSWGSGERNYINGLWAAVAGINNYLNNG
jgi:hypothetical protein